MQGSRPSLTHDENLEEHLARVMTWLLSGISSALPMASLEYLALLEAGKALDQAMELHLPLDSRVKYRQMLVKCIQEITTKEVSDEVV